MALVLLKKFRAHVLLVYNWSITCASFFIDTRTQLSTHNTMKQTTFLLALVALAAIGAAAAHFEDLRSDGDHETPCHEGQAMDACKAYLRKQCTASTMPITWPWKWRMGSCRALKQKCCNQLEQVPPTCRCTAVLSTVQEMQQQGGDHQMSKVRQMAKTLPSTCNMYPNYCNIPTTDEVCYC